MGSRRSALALDNFMGASFWGTGLCEPSTVNSPAGPLMRSFPQALASWHPFEWYGSVSGSGSYTTSYGYSTSSVPSLTALGTPRQLLGHQLRFDQVPRSPPMGPIPSPTAIPMGAARCSDTFGAAAATRLRTAARKRRASSRTARGARASGSGSLGRFDQDWSYTGSGSYSANVPTSFGDVAVSGTASDWGDQTFSESYYAPGDFGRTGRALPAATARPRAQHAMARPLPGTGSGSTAANRRSWRSIDHRRRKWADKAKTVKTRTATR